MLLVPLFLLGTFSMLRFFFSARSKRYAFAGVDAPSSSAPRARPADDERLQNAGDPDEGDSGSAEAAPESGDAPAEEAPVEPPPTPGAPEAPAGPDAPATGDGPPDVTSDATKTPVSSPAIKLDFGGPPDEDASPDADAKPDDDDGPASSPFD